MPHRTYPKSSSEYHLADPVDRTQPVAFRHEFKGAAGTVEDLWGSALASDRFPLFGAGGPNGVAPGVVTVTSDNSGDESDKIEIKGLNAAGEFQEITGVAITGVAPDAPTSEVFRAPLGEMSLQSPSGFPSGFRVGAQGTITAKIGGKVVGVIPQGLTQSAIGCREPTKGEELRIKGIQAELVEEAGAGNKEAFVTVRLMAAFDGERVTERRSLVVNPKGVAVVTGFDLSPGSYFLMEGQNDVGAGVVIRGVVDILVVPIVDG